MTRETGGGDRGERRPHSLQRHLVDRGLRHDGRNSSHALSSNTVAGDRHDERPQDAANDRHRATSATVTSGPMTYDSPFRDRTELTEHGPRVHHHIVHKDTAPATAKGSSSDTNKPSKAATKAPKLGGDISMADVMKGSFGQRAQ